ncbi:uncharacterized protein STEHIDRAFT_116327 [Stereum hirsutum FP-91666 SS1]|uniref:Uncharacterized protein n=1 Tax=Stereum hirsutum (strain FP-91666) TaxID=721885 RepID=R7RY97_STEHR|nr:uncharacterized protein STEHIDRAFT_116327 [Stereum hirsutum FP-91666 SS1]EIM79870.1 hypothetical protein STEHIDRAFT_116327 [Stereum hirsutum FP-91666 SS1]
MSHSSASGADQTAATTVSNSVPGFAPYHPPPHQLNQPMSGPPPPAPPSVPLPSGATAPSTTSSDRALYGPSTSGLHDDPIHQLMSLMKEQFTQHEQRDALKDIRDKEREARQVERDALKEVRDTEREARQVERDALKEVRDTEREARQVEREAELKDTLVNFSRPTTSLGIVQ